MRRSKRQIKPVTFFDETEAYGKASEPKRAKNLVPTPPKTRPADNPPPPEVKETINQPTPLYSPLIRVEFTPFKINLIVQEPINIFLKLLGQESLQVIVAATNAYAESEM